jgi:hypothetical protein
MEGVIAQIDDTASVYKHAPFVSADARVNATEAARGLGQSGRILGRPSPSD